MPTFVFKKKLEPQILKNFLDPICIKNSTHYVINYETLKRARYTSHYDEFIEIIRPYYYPSKYHYIDEPIIYKRFITILRQICTYNNFPYRSTTVYDRSKASLEYHIYYTPFEDSDDYSDKGDSKEKATLLPK
jgi:hypothetical protein